MNSATTLPGHVVRLSSVHREMKGIDLADKRGTAKLAFTSEDAPGLYRIEIEATVRDLRARRFGRTERSFTVK